MGFGREHDHGREPPQGASRTFAKVHALREALLAWYGRARRDLPWRRTRDPYAIWLSEVMLQQTRVETVVPYYERFLARFPTLHALAEAPMDDVLSLWSGLGYYRRARMLREGAAQVVREHGGELPKNAASLRAIRGIGRYTAGAVASIAHGEVTPLVDGNVARVLSRLFALEEDIATSRAQARLWDLADELVAPEDPGAWNQALMELGATICIPRAPRCLVCPARAWCEARARGIEAELPRVAAKGTVARESWWAAVLISRGAVLLGRRRPTLRFGGTWEPPSVQVAQTPRGGTASGARARRAFAALLGSVDLDFVRRGELVHVLSHRRLDVSVFSAPAARRMRLAPTATYDAFSWISRARLAALALSTLARKVLLLAEVAPAGTKGHRDGG
jgi:A/G-specific adenine glycosylase